MVKIDLDLTPKEINNLRTVLAIAWDGLDFHGDGRDMEIPLQKLAKAIGMDGSYWREEDR